MIGSAPESSEAVAPWLAKGFRPFFLLAGGFAALVIALWLLALAGATRFDAYVGPMYWHAHEMVFGFTAAVIAGFLLTAVGNWTGRETAVGGRLFALVALWLAGRVAFLAMAVLPGPVIAVADLAFLPALALVIGRALVAARSRRNYPVLAIVVALWLADLAVHLDASGSLPGWQWRATLGAIDLVILLIVLFSARVVPMFTRNATRVESLRNLPALDVAATAAMAGLTIVDVAFPSRTAAGVLAAAAAALALARSVPWGARHTLRQPLLWVLHVGHTWIIVGLALRAAAELTSHVPAAAAIHALTVGAIGSTTLGMMARVALGHSGRRLVPPPLVSVAFATLTAAAVVRVVAALSIAVYPVGLHISGALWSIAFATFNILYAPILVRPRADGRPG